MVSKTNELECLRLDDKKSSRIQFSVSADGFNKEHWPKWVAWHVEQMSQFETVFKKPLQQAAAALKQQGVK